MVDPREDQDLLAFESHRRAVAAMAAGFFDDLVIAVDGMTRDGIPRADSSLEKLATLKPAFDRTSGKGTHHRGQRLAAHRRRRRDLGGHGRGRRAPSRGPPAARLVDWEMAAVDVFHEGLLMAPAYAIPRLLARHGLTLEAIDLWEIHEAFAAQVLCNVAALESEAFLREKAKVDAPLGKFPWSA